MSLIHWPTTQNKPKISTIEDIPNTKNIIPKYMLIYLFLEKIGLHNSNIKKLKFSYNIHSTKVTKV